MRGYAESAENLENYRLPRWHEHERNFRGQLGQRPVKHANSEPQFTRLKGYGGQAADVTDWGAVAVATQPGFGC